MQAKNGFDMPARVRGRVIGCAVALVALAAMMVVPAAQAGTPAYLALGDSISVGYTQEKFDLNYPNEAPSYFENGFDNFFAKDLAKGNEVGPGVAIVNDACPGETPKGTFRE